MTVRSQVSDGAALKALAIETALAAGAGAVAVSRARTDEVSRERMAAAFERGDLATWGYGEEYARKAADPRAVLAGARSVISIAVP